MAKSLSSDLRRRVVEAIDRGLSCRQAAKRFGVSASSASRWRSRLRQVGSFAPKAQGGDRKSDRIEAEADFLLDAVAETPDITLVELQEKLKASGVSAGDVAGWSAAKGALEADIAESNIRLGFQRALAKPATSTPEIVANGIRWAKAEPKQRGHKQDDGRDMQWRERAIVMAAALAARNYEGDDRAENHTK